MKNSIKLTKKHHQDSPMKPTPHVSMEPSSFFPLPKTHCVYHKEQLITNFCKAPDCLMPLCPECVKIHTEDHTKIGNYGIYETIEETWGSIMGELDLLEENYSKNKSKLQGVQHNNENGKAILLARLHESKRKLIKFLDDFYRGLESEINENQVFYSKDDMIGLEFTESKIMQRMHEIEKFRKKLKGNKFLKYIIIFISSNVAKEHLTYTQEIDHYITQMNNKLAYLRDELQPNFLYSFLNQYITLENKTPILPQPQPMNLNSPPPNYFPENKLPSPQGYMNINRQYPDPISPSRYPPPNYQPQPPIITREPIQRNMPSPPRGMNIPPPRYENPPIHLRNSSPQQKYFVENPYPPYMNKPPNHENFAYKGTPSARPMPFIDQPPNNFNAYASNHEANLAFPYNNISPKGLSFPSQHLQRAPYLNVNSPTPQKNIIHSPHKQAKIFNSNSQPILGNSNSKYETPYILKTNIYQEEPVNNRSPFKTTGNEGLNRFNHPEP